LRLLSPASEKSIKKIPVGLSENCAEPFMLLVSICWFSISKASKWTRTQDFWLYKKTKAL